MPEWFKTGWLRKPCPKCQEGAMASPIYVRHMDILMYRCTVCGYVQEREPKDKKKP